MTRIGLPPLDLVNAYVIDDVLIDSGGRLHASRLLSILAGRSLRAVVLTHAHADHQGSSHEICERLQLPLWCGEGDRAAMETGNQGPLFPNPDGLAGRFATWMAGPPHNVSRTLSEGDFVGSFQVLETPGHTPGHLAFWRESDRVLIMGDVLFHRNPVSLTAGLQEPFRFATADVAANRRAARRLAALDPSVTCFGHGAPLRDGARLREFVAALSLLATLACSESGGDPIAPGVQVGQESLPAADAAYHGSVPHRFLGGSAVLTCSSHGEFTGAVAPPAAPGATVTSDYFATFNGQLVLAPPLVPASVTYPLSLQAHMVEQITLAGTQGAVRTFDTELVTFGLGGSAAPAAMVRESPARGSTGRTTITTLSGGQYRIESYYDVWLEISLDGGTTWHPADAVVRMTLGPP